MNIEKDLGRLRWRFSSEKAFKANENDLMAFNNVIKFCNKKLDEQFIENQLFGKLYIYLFAEFVNYYKASYSDEIPQKELNKLCNMDINLLFEKVRSKLEDTERFQWMNHQKGPLPELSIDEVIEHLQIMVNSAINSYS